MNRARKQGGVALLEPWTPKVTLAFRRHDDECRCSLCGHNSAGGVHITADVGTLFHIICKTCIANMVGAAFKP